MKFLRIEMLFLIWVVFGLFFIMLYGIRKRYKIISDYVSDKNLQIIIPDFDNFKYYIKAIIITISLLFMVLALSGPQYGYKWQDIERKGIDIIVAVDVSKSMLADDIQPNRLERAKREILDLLNLLKGDRIGLVVFAGTAFLQCPLTLDYNAYNLFLNLISPELLPIGGTNISAAIKEAQNSFNEKENSEKAIILITDGENTGDDPLEATQIALKSGIKIYCIGIGKENGVPVKDEKGDLKKDSSGNIVMTKLDEETLKKISLTTGGVYVRSVSGDMDLDLIYNQEIRKKLEQKTLSSFRKQVWEDRYQWFLLIAIVLFIIELVMPLAKKKIAPIILFFIFMVYNNLAYATSSYENIKKGIEAYEKQDYKSALKSFIDAQLNEPEKPEIFYNIGNAFYKLGDLNSAKKNFISALKTQDKNLKQKIHYNLGNTFYRENNYNEAIKNYEEALKIDPEDKLAKENLEFVKKEMEKQKDQQKDQNKDNNNKENKENDNNKEQDNKEQNSQNKDKNDLKKKNNEKKENEDKENKDKENKDKENKNESNLPKDEKKEQKDTMKPDEKNEPDKQAQSQSQKEKQEADSKNEQNNQTDRILDGLKDMPTKALIPQYQKRNIEKDW